MKKIFFASLVFALIVVACTKTDTRHIPGSNRNGHLKYLPDSGLIALYEFNGNVNDGSGNSNNGVIHGNVTYCNDRFGNPNSAAHFDGAAGTYITTVTGGPLGNSPRTVCFWVKSTSYSMQYLVSYGDTIQIGKLLKFKIPMVIRVYISYNI